MGVWIKEKHRWARVGFLGGFVLFPNMQEMVYDYWKSQSVLPRIQLEGGYGQSLSVYTPGKVNPQLG